MSVEVKVTSLRCFAFVCEKFESHQIHDLKYMKWRLTAEIKRSNLDLNTQIAKTGQERQITVK